jgi:AP-1 complex subunit gamma-1
MDLFGPNPTASAAPAPAAPPAQSAFTLDQTQPPPPQPAPAAPRATAYTAYERNGLRITLTPQTSAAKPGYISIQARFQTTGASAASGLVFQAAVPKVCQAKYGSQVFR